MAIVAVIYSRCAVQWQ